MTQDVTFRDAGIRSPLLRGLNRVGRAASALGLRTRLLVNTSSTRSQLGASPAVQGRSSVASARTPCARFPFGSIA